MIKDCVGKIIRTNHRNNIFQASKNSISSLVRSVTGERVIENPPFPALVRSSTHGGMKRRKGVEESANQFSNKSNSRVAQEAGVSFE